MNRRNFIHTIPRLAALPVLWPRSVETALAEAESKLINIGKSSSDENFWLKIRNQYFQNEKFIDFNNAGLGSSTIQINRDLADKVSNMVMLPSRNQSRGLKDLGEFIRPVLAEFVGSKEIEIALLRNATEGLAVSIYGIPLQRGDEVILSHFDYPHVYHAWKQREKRDGIVLRYAELENSFDSPEKIKKAYCKQVTEKTRAICITDLINYNGCHVPTKAILKEMPERVRYRIVDAAQSFANTFVELTNLGGTHVATSLHKWLGAPIGSGLLYVRQDMIEETWPIFATNVPGKKSCSKFEHLGTRGLAKWFVMPSVIDFHNMIGTERKSKRLIKLADEFVNKSKNVKGLSILSPRDPNLKSNIVLFNCDWIDVDALKEKMFKKNSIYFNLIKHLGIQGARLSFNVFHNESDIDKLISAIIATK